MGAILGVVVGTAAVAEVPGLGPLAVCEEPAAAAVAAAAAAAAATAAAAAPVPESSCWFEHPLAEAWEEPSEAGPSLSSLGEELLEEAGESSGEDGREENILVCQYVHAGVFFLIAFITQCTQHFRIWKKVHRL